MPKYICKGRSSPGCFCVPEGTYMFCQGLMHLYLTVQKHAAQIMALFDVKIKHWSIDQMFQKVSSDTWLIGSALRFGF